MNISYNWLKEYVDFNLTPDEVSAALTSIGLETGGVEEVQWRCQRSCRTEGDCSHTGHQAV